MLEASELSEWNVMAVSCHYSYSRASLLKGYPEGKQSDHLCLCCHKKVMFWESINKHCRGTMLDARDATENSVFVLFPELVCLDT